jgi:hypothetical protein
MMMKGYNDKGAYWSGRFLLLREKAAGFLREDRGDLVSSLGWMAIMALLLVLIKGIVDGKLTGYVNAIFSHLDRVFNPGA